MDFQFPKPQNWKDLPLYKKVEIYGTFLNEKHAQYVDKLQVKRFVMNVTNNKIKVAEIMDMCKTLSKPFEYVRVDLYMGTDGIYFSEYTFTPHGGKQRLSDTVEITYGKLWT
jgi:hypothetical protein